MANSTLDPQQEDKNRQIDAFKNELDALPGIEPDRAVTSTFKKSSVYDRPGNQANEKSAAAKRHQKSEDTTDSTGSARDDSSDLYKNRDKAAGSTLYDNQLGSGFSRVDQKAKSIQAMVKKNKKATAGAGVGLTVGGIFALLTVFSGPAQFIQLSHVIQRGFSNGDHTSSLRLKGLFRYARSGNFGETRLGFVGSEIFGRTIDQLKVAGIEFQTTSLDQIKSVTFDTTKLESRFPELKGMSVAEQKAFVADKFELDVTKIDRVNGKLAINTRSLGVKATRALRNNLMDVLDDGRLIGAIKKREFGKFFDLPSLWRPLSRVRANVEKKGTVGYDRKVAEKERVRRLQSPETTAKAVSAKGAVKNALKDNQGKISTILVAQAGLCLVRSIADDAVTLNRTAIVLPSSVQAADKLAIGSQVMSGQDLDAAQLGAVADGFKDSNGQTIWSGQALQAAAGTDNPSGTDLPTEYAQAFSGKTTADGIKKRLTVTIKGHDATGVLCGTAGLVVGGAIGIGALVAGIPSGGSSWAGYAALKGGELAATAGVIYLLQKEITPLIQDKAIVPDVLSGPLGGNLLAYGGRELANIDARASGGVAIAGTETSTVSPAVQAIENQQFNSKSTYAKLFDINDYRSVSGRLISNVSPSFTDTLAKMSSALFHFGGLFSNIRNLLIPKTLAASTPYNWGSPQYGIPDSLAQDPRFENPYTNAETVAGLLVSDSSYISRAKSCFGVDITKDANEKWQVIAGADVNPDSSDYTDKNSNCGDTSDNWQRLRLFIFDSRTMDAVACYQGDDQSCSNNGFNSTTAVDGTSTPAAPTTVDPSGLYGDSTSVACASGTKDLGIQDGYDNNQVVKIRICAVSNLPSTGQESQGEFGVTGAAGKAVVNSRISGAVYSMVDAANKAGVNLQASSAFRTIAHQQTLCPCDGVTVAVPGTSNHQMGLAIDFSGLPSSPGPIAGNNVWDWLSKNASNYGYKNYPREAWHWSPTGN